MALDDFVHLIGGVKFDPPVDEAFPPLSYAGAGGLDPDMPRRWFAPLGGIQYQADAGSCTAHGYSVPIESWAKREFGADLQLCRMDMYFGARWAERNGAETRDGGAFPSKVREWLRDYGTLPESRKAYAPHEVTTWRPDAAWARDRRLLSATYEPIPTAIGPLLHEIGVNETPIPICHVVTDGMFQVKADGIERFIPGPSRGGHCRAIIGYDMDKKVEGEGNGCFLVLNSWRGWGVAHPEGITPDSCSWVPFNSMTHPGFLQDAARLAVPPQGVES